MLFALKKFVSFFLMPMPVCVILLGTGIILAWTKRYQRLGRLLVTAGIALLLIVSNGAFARWMGLSLETQYAPIPDLTPDSPAVATLAEIRYVVVLGGGHGDTLGFAANNKLNTSALSRLVEGVRLVKALPQTRLIVSGAGYDGGPSDAEIMKQAAVALGVDPARITQHDSPKDTMDEAEAIKQRVGPAPFIVVTSAMHIPRAMALLRHLGLNPIPSPVDYRTRPGEPFRFENQLWGPGSMATSTSALHERIGLLWARLRGRA